VVQDERQSHRSRPLAWRRWAPLAISLVLTVAWGIALLGYRVAYDAWPWSAYPSTLHACGRDFQPAGHPLGRAGIADQRYHLVRHGRVPGWFNRPEVWTFDTVAGEQTHALPGGCHVVMWVREGADSYRPYSLEGGP
jgi:hypothetical protein